MPTTRYVSLWLMVLGALLQLGGCIEQRRLPYIQNPQYSASSPITVANARPQYRVQANDVLSIRVQSVQSEFNELFNTTDTRTIFNSDPGVMFLSGYSVTEDGEISLPTVGKLKVGGLTVEKVQELVQQRVGSYVRGANVMVRLLSFKITVLGEVRAPGRYYVYNGQASVLEGLGLAGDLTEFGNRQNVKLIRQLPTGSEVVLLDLTDGALLRSPYFYLLPNDALYVEPLKARTTRANANNLGLVFSAISAVVLLLGYIRLN
ncbi:polysaccharide biosynthesis/export family protein [Hymenobacter sp. BT683]|uniref:Polysaccharide biosynthesis/export family protein n=1 Tax=Hymenobacter jeongseonensis TaxID=2791027 RepID=A0ABS0IDL3_9BACT|nr:polysaccharide biosynthesis/export family protein [Hymenobacter jeongseonensis]MBF9236262.1 polysaccharide biosynthesis/export family protein [Hymenobacter jeongseonensis]